MYLQRLLQINVATLAALATLLLGMGQDNPTKPLLVGLAAAASIWLTDAKGWIRLNRSLASLSRCRWWPMPPSGCFTPTASANPGRRRFDRLSASGLVLPEERDLHLLAVDRHQPAGSGGRRVLQPRGDVWSPVGHIHDGRAVGAGAVAAYGAVEPLSKRTDRGSRPAGSTGPPGRPGRSQPRPFSATAVPPTAAGGHRGRVVPAAGMVGIGTLVLTLVIFFTVPRLGHPAWRGAMPSPKSTVGFSDTVTLGRSGRNPGKPRGSDAGATDLRATNHPYPVQSELYLRGAVLTHYDHGQWTSGRGPAPARWPGGTGVSPVLERRAQARLPCRPSRRSGPPVDYRRAAGSQRTLRHLAAGGGAGEWKLFYDRRGDG